MSVVSPIPDLSTEDLIASRALFSRIFQGLFPFHSLNFYFPDRPQAALSWKDGGKLDEFVEITGTGEKEMVFDPVRKRLFWPLVFHGKPMGFLVFFGLSTAPEDREKQVIERLSNIALEMADLKKQVQLDPETGLYHKGAFRKVLIQGLKDWSKKGGEQKPEKLSLALERPPETLILGFLSLQSKTDKAGTISSLETDWRDGLKEVTQGFPPGTVLATIQHQPLIIGFVISSLEESPPSLRPFRSSSDLDQKWIYHIGWASLNPRDQETFQGNLSKYSLMTFWWQQAWTALEYTRYLGGNPVLRFDEILDKAGKVIDLLPSHRIVINLGQKAGVDPLMRFSILEEGDPEGEKGLAIPLEIQEDLCIAEVVYLRDSGRPLQKNDAVRLVTVFSEKMGEANAEIPLSNGPLRSFQMFQLKLREALKVHEKFALFIGRLDDYADRLKLWGERGLREILKEMNLNLEAKLPPGGVIGPYGRDGFIIFIPEMDREQAGLWAGNVSGHLKQTLNLSLSFGLAYFPCDPFHKGEILDNAIKTMGHLAFLGPGSIVVFDSVTLNISGDKLYNHGDIKGAVREYEKALLLDPNNLNALNSLGVCHANLGQLGQAVETFQRVLALSPEDFMASFNLGFSYAGLGEREKAIGIWEALAQKNGANFDLAYHLGRLYREQKDLPQALSWFKKAEETPDKKGLIYRVLGECEESLGKPKEATVYFKKALKIHPQDAFSLSHLGALYLYQGESTKVALSLCQQATRIEPQKGPYWLNLGKALLVNGFPKRAVNALNQSLSLGEQSKEVFLHLGLAWQALGKRRESQECFIEALKRDPDDQEIQGYLKEKKEA
jgi:tetratricopeptide (TPR) repeat protein